MINNEDRTELIEQIFELIKTSEICAKELAVIAIRDPSEKNMKLATTAVAIADSTSRVTNQIVSLINNYWPREVKLC